jgi:hypothetical protein
VDKSAVEHLERILSDEIKGRFPEGTIEQVALLQYGDDPVVEPGQFVVRVTAATAAASGDKEEQARVARDFEGSFRQQMEQLRHDLREKLPEVSRIEIRIGNDKESPRFFMASPGRSLEARALAGTDLTPVMARLGPADLETLDALITAGIASNRADAVRWALARIRERPAYAQLRAKAAEIEELKAQF